MCSRVMRYAVVILCRSGDGVHIDVEVRWTGTYWLESGPEDGRSCLCVCGHEPFRIEGVGGWWRTDNASARSPVRALARICVLHSMHTGGR